MPLNTHTQCRGHREGRGPGVWSLEGAERQASRVRPWEDAADSSGLCPLAPTAAGDNPPGDAGRGAWAGVGEGGFFSKRAAIGPVGLELGGDASKFC